MKVLYLVSGVGPPAGWGTEFIQNLSYKLSQKGIKITLISPIYANTHPNWKKWIKEQQVKYGVNITPLEAPSWIRKNILFHLTLTPIFITFHIIKLLRKEKFDIIHEFSSTPIILLRAGFLNLIFKVPSIFTLSVYNKTLLGNFFWFKIFNFAKYYLIPSHEIISRLTSMGIAKNKIIFSPPGILLDSFKKKMNKTQARKKLHLPINKFIISYFGPLTLEKGVQEIIQAIPKIGKSIKKKILINLFVIRKGSKEHHVLKEQIINNNSPIFKLIEKYVDIKTVLAASDLIVLPQQTGHGATIPPISIIETVAAGKNLIATNILGNREVLCSSNNFLIPPKDPEALAKAIEKAYKNSSHSFAYPKIILKNLRQYDIHQSIKRHLALYLSLKHT